MENARLSRRDDLSYIDVILSHRGSGLAHYWVDKSRPHFLYSPNRSGRISLPQRDPGEPGAQVRQRRPLHRRRDTCRLPASARVWTLGPSLGFCTCGDPTTSRQRTNPAWQSPAAPEGYILRQTLENNTTRARGGGGGVKEKWVGRWATRGGRRGLLRGITSRRMFCEKKKTEQSKHPMDWIWQTASCGPRRAYLVTYFQLDLTISNALTTSIH